MFNRLVTLNFCIWYITLLLDLCIFKGKMSEVVPGQLLDWWVVLTLISLLYQLFLKVFRPK